jgi:hypothetical protein
LPESRGDIDGRTRKVREVALGVASDRTPKVMMKIVGPDGVKAEAALRGGTHQRGVVQIVFRCDPHRTPGPRAHSCHELGKKGSSAPVAQLVGGIQA